MSNALPGHLIRGACPWRAPSRFAHDAPSGAFSFGVPREVSLSLRRRLVALALVVPLLLAVAAPVAGGSLGHLTPAPKALNFGKVEVNTASDSTSLWIYNSSKASVFLDAWGFAGPDDDDFDTVPFSAPIACVNYEIIPLAPGESCVWYIYFYPDETGGHQATFWNLWTDFARDFSVSANVRGTAY
jgi:hypothetical protein